MFLKFTKTISGFLSNKWQPFVSFQLTGMVNSKYAPAGGRHPDLQFFFYGYSADCSDGIQQEPEEKGRDLQ